MTEKTVVAQLEELTELRAKLDALTLRHKDKVDRLIPEEILNQIKALEHQHDQDMAATHEAMVELEATIKLSVLAGGETVKGTGVMAVLNKPRITWDSKGLTGYMVAHPEIEAFRKKGLPTVTIRKR